MRFLTWGRGLALLGAVTLVVYFYLALFVPGTLRYSPFTIQDDARQFGTWWPQIRDPRLLQGDPMAAYWRAVSPWGYRVPFNVAGWLGIDPLLFARLLPAALIVLCLWQAWRLALKLTDTPGAAFFAAAFCFGYLVHDDSLFGATPRAFSPPLLLLALNAIVARRPWLAVAWLAVLSSIYPTTAVAGFGILALAQVRRGDLLPLVLPRRRILPLVVAGVAIVLASLPLQNRSEPWGPVVTLQQALSMPNMNRPDGRSSIVDENGDVAWVCSARVGYLPEAVPCGWGIPGAIPINILVLMPLLLLALRSARDQPDPDTAARNRIYLHALVACSVCFLAAAAVAFNLHFPGRYTQRILGPLEWLAIGQLLGGWLVDKGRGWTVAVVAFLTLVAATPLPGFVRPSDPRLIRLIARLPIGTRIAGISADLDAVPALTGRAITAAPEQAIPWHMAYYRPYEQRLIRSLELVSVPTAGQLAARLDTPFVLVDRAVLERSQVPRRYALIVPQAAAAARAALARGPSALQRAAGGCAIYRGRTAWLLDSACLRRAR
ncbi:MAG: hypothetical protein ABIT09_13220 [Croceibacterium sp.]